MKPRAIDGRRRSETPHADFPERPHPVPTSQVARGAAHPFARGCHDAVLPGRYDEIARESGASGNATAIVLKDEGMAVPKAPGGRREP